MRLDDYRTSDNVSDQRGMRFGGRGGGGGFGLLLGLVGSRFGIGGIVVLVIGAMLLGFNPFGGGSGVAPQQAVQGGRTAAEACSVDAASRFSCQVLASSEDTWAKIFAANGAAYSPASLTFYSGRGGSQCGLAQSAMGPFYCPGDATIYLDTSFYDELTGKFGAAGDFAQAYVIAHEVGHHVQDLMGTLDDAQRAQATVGEGEGNAVQVRVELQADCYAGVWAARNRNRLEPGDVEEGMTAAAAIGDDTLQRATQGFVVPESFTHGTSEQRTEWLRRGLATGDPASCATASG